MLATRRAPADIAARTSPSGSMKIFRSDCHRDRGNTPMPERRGRPVVGDRPFRQSPHRSFQMLHHLVGRGVVEETQIVASGGFIDRR